MLKFGGAKVRVFPDTEPKGGIPEVVRVRANPAGSLYVNVIVCGCYMSTSRTLGLGATSTGISITVIVKVKVEQRLPPSQIILSIVKTPA